LSGVRAQVAVKVSGDSLDTLRKLADQVRAAMDGIPGVADLQVESQTLVPQIEVRLRPEAAERYGLTPGQVRRAAATFVKGAKVGEVYEGQMIIDVALWGVPRVREDVTSLRDLPIETPGGARAPLGDVADIAVVPAPNEIKRESASRRIDVYCNVKGGHDLGQVAREIETRVKALPFDRGYHPEFLGEYAARAESRNRLFSLAGLALIGILLLLHVDFQSWRLTFVVFLTLPFALIGGVIGALVGGGVLSLGSLIGFVTVLGIAARNGIMLVSHYRHLEVQEGVPFGPGLVLRGAEERLSPILMTALCAGLALVPLVLAGDEPGNEIQAPMGVVILGGLLSSTALNMFVVPALYARFARPKPERVAQEGEALG
ncbi:MAG: efflux RND transporter permease subunit, partial [Candidatus Rokuibacteriota bacterium]